MCGYVYVEVAVRSRAYREALRCACRGGLQWYLKQKLAATDTIKMSNFLFKKYKKLYKMSNIFNINA